MIPIQSIREHQQGNALKVSAPKINLGSSLSRKLGGNIALPSDKKKEKRSVSTTIRKVITARRVSEVFLSVLPRVQEGHLTANGEQTVNPRIARRSTVLGRDDLRIRRLRLKEIGVNSRASDSGRDGEPSKRFYKIVAAVIVVIRLNKSLKEYLTEETNPEWSLLQMKLNVESYFERLLSFRPVDRWTTPSYNGRLATVLTVPPKFRSDEHISTIKALLRGHTAFEDYPDHVKDQMCQAMIYQRYEARRVVTKIGHEARIFYLILSGSMLVNIKEKCSQSQKEFMRTVNQLGRGEAFGEVGLITGNKRNATIVCRTDAELLLIEKEDFDQIIRNPLTNQRDGHVDYVKTMELFKHFPCEVLVDDSQDFFYQYFKPNILILANSATSDYLVVVLSGKCQAVVAYNAETFEKNEKKTEFEKQLEQKFPLYSSKLKREQTDIFRRNISEIENTAANEFDLKAKGGMKIDTRVKQFNERFPEIDSPDKHKTRRRSSSLTGFFDLMETKRKESGKLYPSFWADTLSGPSSGTKQMQPIEERQPSKTDSMSSEGKFRKELNPRKWSRQAERPKTLQGGVRTWKRVAAILGSTKAAENRARAAATTRYAQLAEFNEGKVFGLETLLQKEITPAISLVSEGAECLFISKKIFLEHANAKVLRVVSDLVVTYPSQEFIGTYIRRQKKWKEYKAQLIKQHAKNINSD